MRTEIADRIRLFKSPTLEYTSPLAREKALDVIARHGMDAHLYFSATCHRADQELSHALEVLRFAGSTPIRWMHHHRFKRSCCWQIREVVDKQQRESHREGPAGKSVEFSHFEPNAMFYIDLFSIVDPFNLAL